MRSRYVHPSSVIVKCPPGKKETTHFYSDSDSGHTSPVCTITIAEFGNLGLGTLEWINSTVGINPMDAVLKTVEVPLTSDGTGGVCGGADQTASYSGETTLKAINTAGTPIDLTAVNEA